MEIEKVSYGFGLVKNHPFIDGNKHAGFIVAVVFLELNGFRFQATEAEAAVCTLALAAGDMSEIEFAACESTVDVFVGINATLSRDAATVAPPP